MPRLLIVSNRLPITVKADSDGPVVTRSAGGLATALRSAHEHSDSLWIGWPGDLSRLRKSQRRDLANQLAALRVVPVQIPSADLHRRYDGFSNGALWPLFHYLLDKVHLEGQGDWEAYEEVNLRFADVIAEHYRPGDVIWVHDYQLMLLPSILRHRFPDAQIGFFLHIPFPSSEVFRILPWRERILRGLLGADLLGFHTRSYRTHLIGAASRVLDAEPGDDTIDHEGRTISLGVYPLGVDVGEIEARAGDPAIQEEARRIRAEARGRKIVLGVDRLDYTKGIPRRLLAVERLLEREPDLRGALRFVQIAVPTREKVGAYADFRRLVDEMVGRINGRYGSADSVPIHYLHRSLSPAELAALYVAADVMLVTPLRDGMNLVAKEYVASRLDGSGALVLSEFAGAAAELGEAIQVNPYDIDALASAMRRALAMPGAEQRVRMEAMRRRVRERDVHIWARSFLDDLDRAGARARAAGVAPGEPPAELIERARRAPSLVLLLDYDGTLVPLADLPDLAVPDEDVLDLLKALAARPGTRVHVVSGRRRDNLERWFGALPIELHAEHGFWSREPGSDAWIPLDATAPTWMARIRPILDETAAETPGSFVEEKTAALAWHYRTADPELSHARLAGLRARLRSILGEEALQCVAGAKVFEVRARGAGKGSVVARAIVDSLGSAAAIVAIGDDATDEDLFAALPPSALTIHVGRGSSRAAHRLPDSAAVRRLLRALLVPLEE